jgi:hypothetical protein
VKNGRLVFPSGAEYRVLVLPQSDTMTIPLAKKIGALAEGGAKIVGSAPRYTPGLAGGRSHGREFAAKLISTLDHRHMFREGAEGPAILKASWIGPAARFKRVLSIADTFGPAELSLTATAPINVRVNGVEVQPVRIEHMLDRKYTEGYRRVAVFHLRKALRAGSNEIEVSCEQPVEVAGVLAIDRLVVTDAEWGAPVVGPLGIPPFLSPRQDDIYAPSIAIETLLTDLKVTPDFTADRPLRFAHKQTPEGDLYFVSNPQRRVLNALCTFRIDGRRPELWHPESGEMRELPDFTTSGGRTTVPLRFEPDESYFIVFRRAGRPSPNARNFPTLRAVARIDGTWEAAFDSTPIRFDKLESWTARPEDGVRYYSGTAVYRKTFARPPAARGRLVLDLGVVHEFAQVLLNGKDLGVRWKRPFRFDITDALKAGDNTLEVRVTNLWPNRMIGDERLPPDAEWNKSRLVRWPDWVLQGKSSPTGRFTFTHIRPYTKDSPLLPSGLLGPVTVLA